MLRQHIYNKLEKEAIGQRQLAHVANVNESTISRYMNGYDELKFETILKIVKYLFPDQEKEYISEYALTQKSQNARHCMEYCMINRLWDITEQLIDRLSSSTNPADREWAKVYEFELIRINKQLDLEQLLEELKKFYPNALEVQIMHTFVVAYIYFEMNKHNLLAEHLDNTDKQIVLIKSSYLQECYNIRVGLLMNYIYLYKNNIKKARTYSIKVIEQGIAEHVKGVAYHHLGHSYLYEDYQKASKYLEKAYNLFTDTKREENAKKTAFTLSFVQSYWNIDREFPFELHSYQEITEYIYYLIQKGEISKARAIINETDPETLSDRDKAFHYFYLGIIEKEKTILYQSVKWFRIIDDLFHLQLPIQALRKLDEDEILLQIFNV